MTRTLQILFAAVLFTSFSLNANAQNYFPEIEWSRCYGSSENDDAIDIQSTADGGFIVLGRSSSNDGDLINAPFGNTTWVFKLDASGNIAWQTYLLNNGTARNVETTSDGGYILGGNALTKLDENGYIEWQHPYTCEYVLQTYDGGYALQSKSPTQTNSLRIISKHDNAGNLLWSRNLVEPDTIWRGYFVYTKFIQSRDSSLLIAGWEKELEIPESAFPWMVRIKPDGTVSKKNSLEYFDEFRESHEGKFISILSGNYQPKVMKCDSTLFWKNPVNYYPRDLEMNIDGNIVLGGWMTPGADSISNGSLNKLSTNGDTINNIIVGGSRNDKFYKIALTTDTGYVAIGITNSNDGDVSSNHGKFDIWVVKFLQDTSVHPLPPPVLSVNEVSRIDEVKVYPNPSAGIFHVSLTNDYKDATAEVFNIVGEKIPCKELRTGDKLTIDIQGYPAGQYLLHIRDEKGQKTFRINLTL